MDEALEAECLTLIPIVHQWQSKSLCSSSHRRHSDSSVKGLTDFLLRLSVFKVYLGGFGNSIACKIKQVSLVHCRYAKDYLISTN